VALPAAIGLVTSLASLRLSDNRLEDAGLPWGALGQLRGLTLLSLDRNALTALPDGLSRCSGLVRLSAAGNRIAAIADGALAGLGALQELAVADNCLTALPSTIGVGARGRGQGRWLGWEQGLGCGHAPADKR
jgi:internalin A